ncbi:hypothetical protein D8T51_17540 [Vibrio vulnificus]|jgi:hypothetical protein|uniref:Uncharacterized protein n=1 Tax=Vibrio vulnificus TaxID=672 RepID=A0A2S3SC56_VIBVL|nr:hypothetical protein [Vibrio vulnificus]EWS69695.1 hypothetical protein Y702_07235 [Vibrio vulnificus BAA87]ASJ40346.1 hypothetical protein VVCECT4999_16740 [Vibrio vulnificus]ASM97999.1 hypothetical protein AOT11_00765 [Vibrio vulnificus NBRC 15645 = ATCC 27562]AUL97380.1 hypothetical protein FORC54_3235 [Vibrio vulnificus]AVX01957.1 hypothetical protein BJD94_19040 [Vibrio vulnificus Env1]
MTKKPDRQTAMRNIIDAVKKELPLYESETFVCGPKGECVGCPKKLLEMVDGELSYWEHAMNRGVIPHFDEIRRFGKLCSSVRKGLVRNNLISST